MHIGDQRFARQAREVSECPWNTGTGASTQGSNDVTTSGTTGAVSLDRRDGKGVRKDL